MMRQSFRSHRTKGSVSLKCWLVLSCLLAALLLADQLSLFRSERPLDTRGWKLTDFLEHLESRGLRFHVVPTAKPGLPCDSVYLTEDPNATWESLQRKQRTVDHIDQWQGMVIVGPAYHWIDMEAVLAQSGEFGCRIGNFLLFGDERLLRCIQEACRESNGR